MTTPASLPLVGSRWVNRYNRAWTCVVEHVDPSLGADGRGMAQVRDNEGVEAWLSPDHFAVWLDSLTECSSCGEHVWQPCAKDDCPIGEGE